MASYSSHTGLSPADAVVIGAPDEMVGVAMEYAWLERALGRRGPDWDLAMQALLHEDGRTYDRLDVELTDGTRRSYYFDITGFFGRLGA